VSVDTIVAGDPPRAARVSAISPLPEHSAIVEVSFSAGVPTSLNGIPMSLAELFDVLRTITAVHGLADEDGALMALHVAHVALRSRAAKPSGAVRLEIAHGAMSLVRPACATS
jgi:argininosuccinate synthase